MNRGHLATLLSLGALLTSIIVLGLLSLPKMKEEGVKTPQSEDSPTGIAYRDFVKNAATKAYHSASDHEAERKRNWEENFPFQPTYDRSMVYNPDLYDSQRPDLNRKPGDPLLIPYEGYQEDYTAWELSEDRRMAAQRAILAQDNLKLTPDGQVKNPSTGERLFGGADILIRAPGEKEFVPILPSGQ